MFATWLYTLLLSGLKHILAGSKSLSGVVATGDVGVFTLMAQHYPLQIPYSLFADIGLWLDQQDNIIAASKE